jgi:acetyl esterase
MTAVHSPRAYAQNNNPAEDSDVDDPLMRADSDMRFVLDTLAAMEERPLASSTPREARRHPKLLDAASKLLADRGRALAGYPDIETEDVTIEGPDGDITARVYRRPDLDHVAPMLLFVHGGGWVTGDLESADTVARMLAKRCAAIVVSTHYRLAPEHKFPAAHEDTYAAWLWMIEHAEELGGDRARAGVAGEGVGANMALNIALQARDEANFRPRHLVLLQPLARGAAFGDSYEENSKVLPLGPSVIRWSQRHSFAGAADLEDPRINLVDRADLAGLPPTTIILAEIDPLRSEGEDLAHALNLAGNWVDVTTYDGVTHGFFGLGEIVNKAMFAQSQVVINLLAAFTPPGEDSGPRSRP